MTQCTATCTAEGLTPTFPTIESWEMGQQIKSGYQLYNCYLHKKHGAQKAPEIDGQRARMLLGYWKWCDVIYCAKRSAWIRERDGRIMKRVLTGSGNQPVVIDTTACTVPHHLKETDALAYIVGRSITD